MKCGSHFEKLQKASDEPLKKCENCEGELQKQWSLSGFQFKGEGWYVTDYANKNNGEKKPKESEGENTKKPESTEKAESASKNKKEVKTSTKSKEKPAKK